MEGRNKEREKWTGRGRHQENARKQVRLWFSITTVTKITLLSFCEIGGHFSPIAMQTHLLAVSLHLYLQIHALFKESGG